MNSSNAREPASAQSSAGAWSDPPPRGLSRRPRLTSSRLLAPASEPGGGRSAKCDREGRGRPRPRTPTGGRRTIRRGGAWDRARRAPTRSLMSSPRAGRASRPEFRAPGSFAATRVRWDAAGTDPRRALRGPGRREDLPGDALMGPADRVASSVEHVPVPIIQCLRQTGWPGPPHHPGALRVSDSVDSSCPT